MADLGKLTQIIAAQQLLIDATWLYLAKAHGLDMKLLTDVIKLVQIPVDYVELQERISLEEVSNHLERFAARVDRLSKLDPPGNPA